MIESKRSVSVCLIPKSNELDVPRTQAEERREKRKDEDDSFRKDLGILLEILDSASSEPLETRIKNKVRGLKGNLMKTQEERDVLRNNNQEMESKLAQLLKGELREGIRQKHKSINNASLQTTWTFTEQPRRWAMKRGKI